MRTSASARRRTLVVTVTTTALLAGALATTTPAASAPAPEQPAPQAAPQQPLKLDGLTAVSYDLTLISGDRVRLTRQGAGYQVDVDQSQRGGPAPGYLTETGPDGVYVVPEDARPALAAGRLDKELFDVEYLAANGYADSTTQQVPVIVQYPSGLRARAAALPASTPTRELESVGAEALSVPKAEASTFWQAVSGGGNQRSAAAPTKVWLDRKVKVTLDVSVPLVGAPQAWAAGYDGTGSRVAVLDTGIDSTHPDLTGKVVDSRNFTGTGPAIDGAGHGTHVASTIAGHGAKYKGVAPGAELIIGKVLSDSGSGPWSGIIDGMEWAATEAHADVISMSLGGGPSDGTDLPAQTVNTLTAQTGVLFVIAAGNSGPRVSTVATPAAADAALTVAATDKSDKLASFSSRGPRVGDLALKPDIAAPGVNISAARAAGTTMGTPVDDLYTTASGTSMATPHVAGAAAILHQRHPDWTAAQLKAGLMGTTAAVAGTVYQVGAGRLDVARAVSQQIYPATPNADFGVVTLGASDAVTKQVSYRNLSSADVTLTLTPALATTTGTATSGKLTAPATVTVPAGGTADATVTLDPTGLAQGWYTGSVVATADGVRISTPVGAVLEPPKVQLTVRVLGRDGQPAIAEAGKQLLDLDGPQGWIEDGIDTDDGTVYRVPEGRYSISQRLRWVDGGNRANEALLLAPEITVHGDTEIVLDARTAHETTFSTPEPAGPLYNAPATGYQRSTTAGEIFTVSGPVGDSPRRLGWTRYWVTPTDPVKTGMFRFWQHWWLGRSEVAMSVRTPGRDETLHPATSKVQRALKLLDDHPGWVPWTGSKDLRVVDVGLGLPADLAGKDLRGKLALMEANSVPGQCGISIERVKNVKDAGAAAIVAFPPAGSGCPIPMDIWQEIFTGPAKPVDLPLASIPSAEGLKLRARPATVRVTGTPDTPYSYVLHPIEDGRVPSDLHYRLTDKQLARYDLAVHSSAANNVFYEQTSIWHADDLISLGTAMNWYGAAYQGPRTRREYVGPLDPKAVLARTVTNCSPWPCGSGYWSSRVTPVQVLDRPFRVKQDLMTTPVLPGSTVLSDAAYALPDQHVTPRSRRSLAADCALCREGNYLVPYFPAVDASGSAVGGLQLSDETHWKFDYKLTKDGTEVPPTLVSGLLPVFEVPADLGAYELTATGPNTTATWKFRSGQPTVDQRRPGFGCFLDLIGANPGPCRPEQALFVGYDLGSSQALDNTVSARGEHEFKVRAYHQPSLAAMPAVAGLKLWYSTDDGAHWQRASVRNQGHGVYSVKARYPRGSTHVGLRTEAWDTAGNRITQTTKNAFTLR